MEMGPWESFGAAWHTFWDRRGVIGVTAVNFVIVLLGETIAAAAGIPVLRLNRCPFGSLPLWLPALRAAQGQYLIFAGLFLLFVVTTFVAAATPASLLDALGGEFSVISYCEKGVRYFWRALAFEAFYLGVMVVGGGLSAALFLVLGRVAGPVGWLVAAVLLLAPWIWIAELLTVTLVGYLTNREFGLGTHLTQAVTFVHEKYLPFLGLVVVIVLFSLAGAVLTVVVDLIPFIGSIAGLGLSTAVNIIALLAVMYFAGVA